MQSRSAKEIKFMSVEEQKILFDHPEVATGKKRIPIVALSALEDIFQIDIDSPDAVKKVMKRFFHLHDPDAVCKGEEPLGDHPVILLFSVKKKDIKKFKSAGFQGIKYVAFTLVSFKEESKHDFIYRALMDPSVQDKFIDWFLTDLSQEARWHYCDHPELEKTHDHEAERTTVH